MENLKNISRLAIGILAYLLVSMVFTFASYFGNGNGNEQEASTKFVLVLVTAFVAYRFALKLIEWSWSDVDSVLAQTFNGGRSTIADRISWNVALFIYFGGNLIFRHLKGTNSGLSTTCEILLMLLTISQMGSIYLKIKLRRDGRDIPEMREKE